MSFAPNKRKFRVHEIITVKMPAVFTLQVLKHLAAITLVELWFAKTDKAYL